MKKLVMSAVICGLLAGVALSPKGEANAVPADAVIVSTNK